MKQEKYIHGIAMGTKRKSRLTPLGELREKGVIVRDNWITHFRMGIKSGARIDYRLNCADALKADSSQFKDEKYLQIALAGVRAQTFREGKASQVFNSIGHTDDIAKTVGLKPEETRRVIRAMRADLVYDNLSEKKSNPEFIAVATGYLNGYIKPAGIIRKDSIIFRIYDEWDGETFAGFYSLLYQGGPRTIGTWTPYECEVFADHYKQRLSRKSILSDFDRLVLETGVIWSNGEEEISRVRINTGIEIDSNVIEHHRNFLVHGKVISNLQRTS